MVDIVSYVQVLHNYVMVDIVSYVQVSSDFVHRVYIVMLLSEITTVQCESYKTHKYIV